MSAKSDILVVIPTYNEAENIRQLAEQLLALGLPLDVLIVDDNSPDGTGRIADEMAASDERIRVLHREGKLGLGTAYRAGLKDAIAGKYSFAVTMDADFSHDPCYIPEIYKAACDRDLVIGSRYVLHGGVENWPLRRRILSRTANAVARLVLRLRVADCTAGYRCYRTSALSRIALDEIRSNGYSFLEEMIYLCDRAGFRIGEVPIIFRDRRGGESKISKSEIYKAMWTLLRLRWQSLTGTLPEHSKPRKI
ncbi:MAG TPA: polyprenol monophosphomannose synthase [Candidatus Brocadiia bacterium]|nr:polyprenol monophosphomannose synthase [Candidatus Brocadiia bacterium]